MVMLEGVGSCYGARLQQVMLHNQSQARFGSLQTIGHGVYGHMPHFEALK